MKFSFVTKAVILGSSVSTGQARRLAEFGASMSMSSEDIVQLTSFGESAAFGPGETTGTMASAKAAKPSSGGGKSGKAIQPSTAPSVSAMPSVSAAPSGSSKSGKAGPNSTYAKAMKLDADATSGKSGKGNNVLKESLVDTSLTIPTDETETGRLLLSEGPYELWIECSNADGPAILMRPVPGFEETNWYGQVEVGPESGTYPEGSDYTLWRRATDANNNPSVGAVAFEGATSKTRWYLGLEGSSFVGTYDSNSKTCEYSGIITQGKSLVASMTSSKGNKEPGMMSSKSSKATSTTSTTTPTSTPALIELETIYDAEDDYDGVTFDIEVINDIRVVGLKVNFDGNAGNSANIKVYYYAGSFNPVNPVIYTPGAWTLLVDTTVTSVGFGAGTMIEFPTPKLLSGGGTTHAFYIQKSSGPDVMVSGGATDGSVSAEDANVKIKAGRGVNGDFVYVGPNAKVFNGALVYQLA